MLASPPPGFNPNSINQQNETPYQVPGQQGGTALGYNNPMSQQQSNLAAQYSSSAFMPSSLSMPSSVPAPQSWYNQGGDQAGGLGNNANLQSVLKSLMGAS